MNQHEIWLVNLDPTIGAEIKKKRPCVIVNNNAMGILPLKIILPITSWQENKSMPSWFILLKNDLINNLKNDSIIDCFQPRAVSIKRLIKKIGVISEQKLQEIHHALYLVFGINKNTF
jgi:mRNA interferase MazF